MPFLNNDSAFALIVPRTAGIATHAQVLGISLAMSPDVPSLSPAGKVQPFQRGFSANLGRNQASSFLNTTGIHEVLSHLRQLEAARPEKSGLSIHRFGV